MNWLDILVSAVFIVSMVAAFRNGFSHEVIRLIALTLGIIGGFWYYGTLSNFLEPYIANRQLSEFVAFMFFLVGSLVAGAILSWTFGKLMGWTGMRWFDRMLGVVFGFLRGLMINAVFILGLVSFAPFTSSEEQLSGSRFSPFVLNVAKLVADLAPKSIGENFSAGFERVRASWNHSTSKSTVDE